MVMIKHMAAGLFCMVPWFQQCAPPPERTGAPWVAIGDSVMYSVAEPLRQALPEGGVAYVEMAASLNNKGWGERSITDSVCAHASEARQDGTVIVQDDGSWTTYTEQVKAVQRLNQCVPADVRIMWVIPYSPFERGRDAEIASAVAAQAGGHLSTVVDWGAENAGRNDLLSDLVHPNELGGQVFAEMVAAAW